MDNDFVQLKWHTHQSSFLENLSSLRDKQVFTDVTLSCGNNFYPAHRLVLRLCSTFLSQALEIVSNPSPVILLYGITQDTLEHLLMFMYDGQVTVARNKLPQLLKAANWLGVKGLASAYANFSESPSKSDNESVALKKNALAPPLSQGAGTNDNESMKRKRKDTSPNPECSKNFTVICKKENTSPKAESSEKSTGISDYLKIDSDIDIEKVDSELNEYDDIDIDSKDFFDEDKDADSFEGWDTSEVSPSAQKLKEFENGVERQKRSLKCRHCKCSFTVRSELAEHLRLYHDFMSNFCSDCNEYFFTDEEYDNHMIEHNFDKLNTCNYCDHIASTKRQLNKHIAKCHKDECSNKCDLCDFNATTKAQLTKHMDESHKNEMNFRLWNKCDFCDFTATTKILLVNHMEELHKVEMNISLWNKCRFCDYVSETKTQLIKHMEELHKNMRNFSLWNKCGFCDYLASTKTLLTKHMEELHKDKTYSSSLPNKVRIVSRSEMPEAVVKLEAIPIMKCSKCSQAFRGMKSLFIHHEKSCYKIVKSDVGFHCPECTYVSQYKQRVQDHICTHTGVHPFRCTLCKFQCRRRHKLEEHMLMKHRDKF